jgi:hypothetical protein
LAVHPLVSFQRRAKRPHQEIKEADRKQAAMLKRHSDDADENKPYHIRD